MSSATTSILVSVVCTTQADAFPGRMEEAVRQLHTPLFSMITLYSSRFACKPHLLTHTYFGVRLTASRKSKVRCQVICQLMPSAFCSASFYTLSRESEALMKRVGEELSHHTRERKRKV